MQIIGKSTKFKAVLAEIATVGETDCTVLLQGETGTGKEIAATTIHDVSNRRTGPFVAVNCYAIPADLLESELFGPERGAFTGAVGQRNGKFQAADRGTLFLDEIGDLPIELQPKLLRVLQERKVEPGVRPASRLDARPRRAQSGPNRARFRRSARGPDARRHPRQRHALLVNEYGALFGSSLLGKQALPFSHRRVCRSRPP
jgi:transcriptional regulator with AAA-type ATPase domain